MPVIVASPAAVAFLLIVIRPDARPSGKVTKILNYHTIELESKLWQERDEFDSTCLELASALGAWEVA